MKYNHYINRPLSSYALVMEQPGYSTTNSLYRETPREETAMTMPAKPYGEKEKYEHGSVPALSFHDGRSADATCRI